MQILPLDKFPVGSSSDPDHAQSLLSRELTDVHLTRVAPTKHFRLDMRSVRFGKTGIVSNEFATDTDVNAGVLDGQMFLIFGTSKPSVSYVNDQEVVLTEKVAVVSPGDYLIHERKAGASVIVLTVDIDAVRQRLREFAGGDVRGALDFSKSADLSTGPGLHAKLLTEHLSLLLHQDSTAIQNPLLVANFEDMLLNTFSALPNRHTEKLLKQKDPGIAPASVKRAEAYMEANASQPITVTDLLEVCQCSRRSLFDSFRKFRGYSPLQFLAQLRLKHARERLSTPLPGDTVQSIAFECGFSHMGRFSAAYREYFGEQPRETLQKYSQN